MSYEGYEQLICENGHYWEEDALQMFEEYGSCRVCQGKVAWRNSVDQTNGPSQGEIPYRVLRDKFRLTPAVLEVCNLGHAHEKSPDIFRIPTREETKPLRVYVDEDLWQGGSMIQKCPWRCINGVLVSEYNYSCASCPHCKQCSQCKRYLPKSIVKVRDVGNGLTLPTCDNCVSKEN